jgi:NitT/TauT family transport system substrate-binding protein
MVKSKIFFAALTFITLFIVWECYSLLNPQLFFVVPPPSQILQCFFTRFDRLMIHTAATAREMIGGMILAMVAAFPLAWGMYFWHALRSVLQPLFIVIQCIPMFALAPIMVFWFDWSYSAVVIPTALMIFFPLTLNIYHGLCSTPRQLLDYFRVNQATAWQTFWKLQLPSSIPHLIAGFRITTAIAGIGAVAGEWGGAQSGLGMLMLESRRSTELAMTFAALFCLTFLSVGLYGLALLLEKILIGEKMKKAQEFIGKNAGILMFACLLFSCSNQKSSLPSKAIETRLILDWLPNPNHIPIFTGIEKGFFQERGIHLKVIKIADPGDSISFLSTEKADLALYYMPPMYLAIKQGAQVWPVGFLIKQPLGAFIFRTGLGIEKPEDLNQKRLGYVLGGFEEGILNTLLKEKNIQLKERLNVGFDLVGTMGTKKVDVIYGAYWNIETEHLRSLGVETDYFPVDQFGHPDYYELLFLAKKGTRYTDEKFIDDFRAAIQASIDYSADHPEEAFTIYVKNNPDKGEKTLEWEKKAWSKTIPVLAKDQDFDLSVWESFVSWMKKNNL